MMLPKKLKKGDAIGILSPSDPIIPEKKMQLQNGIKLLNDLGFRVVQGKYIASTNPKEKAEDLNTFFSNPEINAIICTQGGNSAEQILPFIDWKIVQNNPKIFMGISDITVLLNAMNKKTGLITFHGNDICYGFGRNPSEYDKQEFLSRLVQGKIGDVTASRERKTIRVGKGSGKLVGGNLRCLLKLAGTEYWPDFRGAILMLEAYRLTEEGCLENFKKLKEMKVFDQINGVIVGFIYGAQVENPKMEQMEDVLVEFTKEYDFPILKVNDFGHNCPNTTLPIGCMVELDATKKTIKIIEKCVE